MGCDELERLLDAKTYTGPMALLSETNKLVGEKLRAYYQACTKEQLPPRLLAVLKKLDEEIEPSAEHVHQ